MDETWVPLDDSGALVCLETGEVQDAPADTIGWLARRHREAGLQERAWAQAKAAASRALVALLPERKVRFDDVEVRVQVGSRTDFNRDAFREEAALMEWTREELVELLCAAKDFDLGLVSNPELAKVLDGFREKRSTAPYAITSVTKKAAPSAR